MKNIFPLVGRLTLIAPMISMTVGLAACDIGSEAPPPSASARGGSGTAVGFAQFPDIAVPGGAKMDVDRTLVLGTRDAWIGRLAMSTGSDVTSSYDFFLREMPKFGWQEITTVRSGTSVLTYTRGERVATVQIGPKTLGGSNIDITVSPRGTPQPTPSVGLPSAPVTAVPLR
tara:strand:+ start:129 stop:644 length:516 start_codon:yes stop_codon:yes gene_type:complete